VELAYLLLHAGGHGERHRSAGGHDPRRWAMKGGAAATLSVRGPTRQCWAQLEASARAVRAFARA